MFIITAMLSIMVAWLRGGSLRSLLDVRLVRAELIIGALAIRLSLTWAAAHYWPIPSPVAFVLYALAFVALLYASWLNRRLSGIAFLGAGVLANFLVIMANGGRMPVSEWALVFSGQGQFLPTLRAGAEITHILVDSQTRLWFLGDVLALPAWLPMTKAFSAGDVLVMIGFFMFVQAAMLPDSEVKVSGGA